MKIKVRRSFQRDLAAIGDWRLQKKVDELIDAFLVAKSLREIVHLKKLKGSGVHWSLRIGEYRLGMIQDGDVFILARVMHRREFYRFFP